MDRKINQLLLVHSIVNVILQLCKMWYTQSLSGAYFIWNLFLASIPFYISIFLAKHKEQKSIISIPLLMAWMLFLPNAPYIITDYVHLYPSETPNFWFSLLIFFSFALNGLLYGICSIVIIRKHFFNSLSTINSALLSIAISLLCGYGVFIGRFLRWNSWSVITKPFALLQECILYLIHPQHVVHTWGFLSVFAVLVYFPVTLLELVVGKDDRTARIKS
jgi:uncharacterized membrane protein